MANRSRIEIPLGPTGETILLSEALERPLADTVGIEVGGMSSRTDLHKLLIAQGGLMLNGAGIRTPDLDHALRQLSAVHGREEVLYPDEQDNIEIIAQVLTPFAPNFGYDVDEEAALGKPLRMTFGFTSLIDTEENEPYVGIRCNLWVTKDHQSPLNTRRVLKESFGRFSGHSREEVSKRLWGFQRSRGVSAPFVNRTFR